MTRRTKEKIELYTEIYYAYCKVFKENMAINYDEFVIILKNDYKIERSKSTVGLAIRWGQKNCK